ncbi:MAG TPA: excinuclease ABC subunit UvrC [Gammaproteobacteria bacterium]|nr:excinuclease ABC subunit UvrC [Gammaproteobacteria bacterium]
MQNSKLFLSNVTHQPGVYQMLDEKGHVLYIGKARDLKKRLGSYFSNAQKDLKTTALLKQVETIDITVTHTENEALILECNLIKQHKPHYNVLFRDDKSYPYILITDDKPYPRVDFYRGNKKKRSGTWFGPFPNGMAVRETINFIEKIFKIRNCTNSFFAARTRPCMQYQIERCTAPCVGYVSPDDYEQQVRHAILFLQGKNEEVLTALTRQMDEASKQLQFEKAAGLRDQIAKLREIQTRQYVNADEGDIDVIGFALAAGLVCIQLLIIRGGRMLGSRAYYPNVSVAFSREEILMSFIAQHYLGDQYNAEDIPREIIMETVLAEQDWLASALRDRAGHKVVLSGNVRHERKKWVDIATNSAKQSVTGRLLLKSMAHDRFDALKTLLSFDETPSRIECFDVSHSMGESPVASCVVFNREGAVKSDYRRFNISGITPGDDVAAMRQALTRRYARMQSEQAVLPDILLIDGGKPQLNAAKKVLAELDIKTIFLIGVAKGVTRKPGFETLYFTDHAPIHLPPDSLALHLIQQIRDEAHRFAITGHRARRDKKRVTSVLETIPGIGAKRRRELLQYFGGIQALKRASVSDIAKVPGISLKLAQRIFSVIHQ